MSDDGAAGATAENPQPTALYHIDEAWYERNSRTLEGMIADRLGAEALPPGKTVKRKKAPAAPAMADLAKIEGFVSPQLPVLEAVFRLFLVHENKPMDLEQLAQELAENGLGIKDTRVITPKVLARLLDSDTFYGLARVQTSQEG